MILFQFRMNFHYIEQILVKQFKFPSFIAQYILNFLWFEDVMLWQAKFNSVMVNLVKKPQINPIHSQNALLSMRMLNTFPVMEKVQLENSNIIQYKMVNEIDANIDATYFIFHTYIARNKYF
jgi:hypothetical protein